MAAKLVYLLLILGRMDSWACSACGFAEDGSRWGFIFTTFLLTIVPLTAIGAFIYILWRRAKNGQK